MSTDGKELVRRLVYEVMNDRRLDAIDEIYSPSLAPAVRRWIEPFLASFDNLEIRVVQILQDGDVVVARFTCSGTHTGSWLGHPPTGRRFHNVAEVYFFRVSDGHISWSWGLEDTLARMRQLGRN